MKQITMTADIKTMALTDKLRLAKERIAEIEQERDSLKEQVRVREDFMRMMRDYMNRSSTNDFTLSVWGQFVKDYPYMLDVFDENGKVLDE